MDMETVKELKKTTEAEIGALLTNLLQLSGMDIGGMTFHVLYEDFRPYRRVEVNVKLALNV